MGTVTREPTARAPGSPRVSVPFGRDPAIVPPPIFAWKLRADSRQLGQTQGEIAAATARALEPFFLTWSSSLVIRSTILGYRE